jgi:integrase
MQEWARKTGPNFSSYVFANPNAPAIHLKSVRKTWARALNSAKVEKRPIYDLRATFASRLSAAGNPDNLVAGMLGHSSPSIVSTYAKVVDEFSRQAIQKLENLRDSQVPNPKAATETSEKGAAGNRGWVN